VGGRRKEIILERLRLGKCRLKAYNFSSADRLCNVCRELETVGHFLLHCEAHSDLATKLIDACDAKRVAASVGAILNDSALTEFVFQYIIEKKINI